MVHKSDLVIIGISVGLALGILIASLICCGLRWFKKRKRTSYYNSPYTHTWHRLDSWGNLWSFSYIHALHEYKATMPTGDVVAVKVLASDSKLGEKEFQTEVADFGLSKEEVFDGRNSGLKGTHGYIDPVYVSTNKLTMKSDVYSFGIIVVRTNHSHSSSPKPTRIY